MNWRNSIGENVDRRRCRYGVLCAWRKLLADPACDPIQRQSDPPHYAASRARRYLAAEAYGKLTGRPAAGFVSRGPGSTNAAIGIHTAAQDSSPLVLFVGHVPTTTKAREAFQEINYHQMYGAIAKAVLEPEHASDVANTTARGLGPATSGRPGPVIVVMPKDITDGDVAVQSGLPSRQPGSAPTTLAADAITETKP